jgi:tellurite resistance protein TerC
VFVIIFARFGVPRKYQQEVLMVGIIIALVLRAIFILLGAQLIENFSWIFYLFGAFLIYTAVRQWFENHQDMEQEESRVIRFLRRHISITEHYDGGKLRTVVDGKKVFTPILVVFIALGLTDLLFALDSIPAIFGITTDPFLVFAANIFALMGLRQLYFLLGDLIEKLVYLHYGIAFILAFIGVKLVFHALHTNQLPFINGGHPVEWAPEISTVTSLAVIVGSMAVATVASLIKIRIDSKRSAPEDKCRATDARDGRRRWRRGGGKQLPPPIAPARGDILATCVSIDSFFVAAARPSHSGPPRRGAFVVQKQARDPAGPLDRRKTSS